MSISIVQNQTNAASGLSATATYGSGVGAGNILAGIIQVTGVSTTETWVVTDTLSTSYTNITLIDSGGAPNDVAHGFFGIAPSGGANTITITLGTSGTWRVWFFEISGLTSPSLDGSQAAHSLSVSTLSATINSSTSSSIIIGQSAQFSANGISSIASPFVRSNLGVANGDSAYVIAPTGNSILDATWSGSGTTLISGFGIKGTVVPPSSPSSGWVKVHRDFINKHGL